MRFTYQNPAVVISSFSAQSSDFSCKVSKLLTVYISGDAAENDEVGLIDGSADDPVQSVFIVNQNALFGHAIRHNPDTEQKHEEEQIHHLQREEKTFIAQSVCICFYAKIYYIMRGSYESFSPLRSRMFQITMNSLLSKDQEIFDSFCVSHNLGCIELLHKHM